MNKNVLMGRAAQTCSPQTGLHGQAKPRRGYGLAVCQLMFAVLVVAGLVVVPPSSGRMLLVPLTGSDRDSLASMAVGAGSRLVGNGPFKGSLVVAGDRGALMSAFMPRRVLVLRAFFGGCGESGVQA